MATHTISRSILCRPAKSLSSLFTRSFASSAKTPASSSLYTSSLLSRSRPLVAAAFSSVVRGGLVSAKGLSTQATTSSLNDPNPNWSNRPPKETILLDGCDFEHWLVVVDKPEGDPTRDEIIESYIKILAQIVGSEEEARMKIYSVSTRCYYAFGALVSGDLSHKLKELPNVRWVLPDSYLDVKNKDYGEVVMAASISRRIFSSFGSLSALGRSGSPNFSSGNGLCSLLPSDVKCGMSLLSNRKLSSSILTPDSSDDSFPSDLLLKKTVIGQYQDLVIPVTNFQNEDKGFMVLAGDVFDVPIRKDIIHNVVRWQLAKRQQGTHSTKTLSEVSGTGRKPWNQKGTGRARHGTLRGPQFRGGCVMHGPKPRSHAIKMNKQVRRLGLKIALTARAAEGKLLVFDDLALPTHKTKNIVKYYDDMENTKKVLIVEGGPIDEKLKRATQNLHYVNILPSIGLNVYSILLHDTLVMSRDAVNKIVESMHTPINR